MMRIQRAVLVLCLFALVGCGASAPPSITYYLLRGEQVEGSGPIDGESVRVGLGRIVVAPYLLGAKGVMIETGPGEVRPASQHQWAEPLDSGVLWYLRSEIGSALGYDVGGGLTDRLSWDYVVEVAIARMHGTMDGRAVLEAEFVITPSDPAEPPTQGRFSKSSPLPREGYAGVVEAQRALLSEFASQIAAALRPQAERS